MKRDRIKLADAMKIFYRTNATKTFYIGLPDPFTDVNDDYAVLEWLTENHMDAIRHGTLGAEMFCYQIGDYARAALKVLEITGVGDA